MEEQDALRKHMEYLVKIGDDVCTNKATCRDDGCPFHKYADADCFNHKRRVELAKQWLLDHPEKQTLHTGWYVFNITMGTCPRVMHKTLELAEKEAERLSIKVPGNVFQVLQIIGQVQTQSPTPQWEKI